MTLAATGHVPWALNTPKCACSWGSAADTLLVHLESTSLVAANVVLFLLNEILRTEANVVVSE